MRKRLRPSDVFKPGELPLREENVYATRAEPERQLARFLERGQFPVVFGEFGVGKTTLVARFLQERVDGAGETVVNIPSTFGIALSDIYTRVLEKLNYSVERQSSSETSATVQGGFKAFVATFRGSVSSRNERVRELVVSTPTELGVLNVMAENKIVLCIDEVHKASPELREGLANAVKAIKTANLAYPKVILIGTTLDAEKLVRPDPGIDRYVKELLVKPLADDEAHYIISEGMSRLALEVPDDLQEQVVRTAAGAPTIVQSVCLDMAESTLEGGRELIDIGDYEAAVQHYLEEHARRLAGAYLRAIETTGPRRYRKRILFAMADAPQDYVTLEYIREHISEQLGETVESTALSGPLRALKEADYGRILQDVDRLEGTRVFNLSAFSDPMMKSFIRFMRELENQGLVES